MKTDQRDPLTPMVDRYLIERRNSRRRLLTYTIDVPERPRYAGRLSPSSIAGCQRKAVFNFLGAEKVNRVDPDTELIFEDGNWRHHKWQCMFRDMTKVLGKERFQLLSIEKKVLIPELYVCGRYDALIKINGKKYVVDFKGIRDYGFQYVYREHKPKEEHVKQLLTYCVARNVRRGILLYDNKDNQSFKCYVIEWDEDVWGEVERWCQKVIASLNRRQLPARHPGCSAGTFLFEHCVYAPICYGKYRDDPERIRRMVFRDFEGIDEAWKVGQQQEAA